jgi:hypothetical protein
MKTLLRSRYCARLLAVLATSGCVAALTACGHAPAADSGGAATAGNNDDPWVSQGSVEAGPMIGNPKGPYAPRR